VIDIASRRVVGFALAEHLSALPEDHAGFLDGAAVAREVKISGAELSISWLAVRLATTRLVVTRRKCR
jgi:hypothetical protein